MTRLLSGFKVLSLCKTDFNFLLSFIERLWYFNLCTCYTHRQELKSVMLLARCNLIDPPKEENWHLNWLEGKA